MIPIIYARRLNRARPVAGLMLAVASAALTACAVGLAPEPDARAGLSCVDDTPGCIASRQKTLKHLVEDPNRGWVKEPATPEAYASGVRLFAYKSKKKELSCEELALGLKEAEGARAALKSAASLTAAQSARGAMLATEVARELGGEIKRRCPKRS